jgi:PTS system mannose-specific IIB component
MLLFSNPRAVRMLIEKGVRIDSVNIGGMRFSPGKRRIISMLYVDNEDIKDIMSISDKGVELEIRAFPGDRKTNIADILGKGQGYEEKAG